MSFHLVDHQFGTFSNLVHRDGVVHSGLLVIALNVFMRLRDENEVNIVLEIKLARRSRPEFIPTVVRRGEKSDSFGAYVGYTSDIISCVSTSSILPAMLYSDTHFCARTYCHI